MMTVKFTESSHSDEFILMSKTLFILVENNISFGKRTKLTKDFNNIIKLAAENNFYLKTI